MEVRHMRQSILSHIKAQIASYKEHYLNAEAWTDNEFGDEWSTKLNIQAQKVELLHSNNPSDDLENVKRFYSAFSSLQVSQAADERLWAYFSHAPFWEYVASRWPFPVEGDAVAHIERRYFFRGSRGRAIMRNAIARLWWFGYATHDPKRADPFELTKILLSRQRLAHDLMERGYCRNRRILHAILQTLGDTYGPSLGTQSVRSIARHLTFTGGVSLLDSMSQDQLSEVIRQVVSL